MLQMDMVSAWGTVSTVTSYHIWKYPCLSAYNKSTPLLLIAHSLCSVKKTNSIIKSIITKVRCHSTDMMSTSVFKQQLPEVPVVQSIDSPSSLFIGFGNLEEKKKEWLSSALFVFRKWALTKKAISCGRKEEKDSSWHFSLLLICGPIRTPTEVISESHRTQSYVQSLWVQIMNSSAGSMRPQCVAEAVGMGQKRLYRDIQTPGAISYVTVVMSSVWSMLHSWRE